MMLLSDISHTCPMIKNPGELLVSDGGPMQGACKLFSLFVQSLTG